MSKRQNHVLREQRIANRRVDNLSMHQIVAEHTYTEPAKYNPSMNRRHEEALRMNETQHLCFTRDCGLWDWECSLLAGDAMTASDYAVEQLRDRLMSEDYEDLDLDAIEDEAWEWLAEQDEEALLARLDEVAEDKRDHWIPWLPDMDTCRDYFGGSDFLVFNPMRSKR